jgi:hypothetical protein
VATPPAKIARPRVAEALSEVVQQTQPPAGISEERVLSLLSAPPPGATPAPKAATPRTAEALPQAVQQTRPPAGISEDRVVSLLRSFLPQRDFYVGPDIPPKKLENAKVSYGVPPGIRILGLINCTVFGSAKNGLAFCRDALYYHNGWASKSSGSGSVRYIDLVPEKVDANEVQLAPKQFLNMSGSSCSKDKAAEMLRALNRLVKPDAAEDVTGEEQADAGGALPCPKCGSRKTAFCGGSGFVKRNALSLLGGFVGEALLGPIGGAIGSGVGGIPDHFHCAACGHDWQGAQAASRVKKGDSLAHR